MKTKLKRIISGILFFSIFISIIMYAGIIGRPFFEGAYNYNNWQYFYKEDDNTHNVITIGSSAIYRYWMPALAYEEQGFTSFTIGSNRQPFGAVPYIIEEVMKSQSPDLIIVETRSLINQRIYEIDDSENGQPDMQSWVLGIVASGMNYSSTRFNMIHENYVDTEGDCELYWHIPILKYHSLEYTLPLPERLKRIIPQKDVYKSTNLVPQVERIDKLHSNKKFYGEYYLTDEQKTELDSVVEKSKEYNVNLLFVATPYLLDTASSSMQKSLQDYIKEKNYPYIDLNDYVNEIGLDNNTDFYNSLHTNIAGAEKVTRYLSKYIAENYELNYDILSKTQQKEWETFCKNWNIKKQDLNLRWKNYCENQQLKLN